MARVLDDHVTGTWVLDPQRSAVTFTIRHLVVKKVPGVFTGLEGRIVTRPDITGSSVHASVPVRSMDTGNAGRDEGTRAKDPFDAEAHPAITFTSTAVTPEDDGVRVDGALTIRGVTRPVALDVTQLRFDRQTGGAHELTFRATGRVDRQDFGVRFAVPLDRQGFLAGNRVDIALDVVARLVDDVASGPTGGS